MKFGGLLFSAMLVAGCASGQATGRAPMPDRNLLTRAEIDDSQSLTAYDMVRALRPFWLNERGVSSLRNQNPIILYINDARVGSVDRLKEYAPRDLDEARFLDATAATRRFGTGHRSGAILLYMRRGQP